MTIDLPVCLSSMNLVVKVMLTVDGLMPVLFDCASTAMEVESLVRAQGAIPATVGVLRGRVHVGLSSEELEYLARSEGSLKVSRRDLPYAISKVGPKNPTVVHAHNPPGCVSRIYVCSFVSLSERASLGVPPCPPP